MSESPPSQPSSTKSRLVLWLVGLGVPMLLLLAWWPSGKPKARPVLPNPNGYDYFVKAASNSPAGMWTNKSLSAVPEGDLRGFLAMNEASLNLLREGLRFPSVSHRYMDFDPSHKLRLGEDLGPTKRVGVLLAGAGRLAELEGTNSAALEGYVSAMRYGQEVSRRGVMIERLVGISVENLALAQVRSLLPQMMIADARHALEQLHKLDASHDGPMVNLAAEAEWVRQSFSAWHRLMSNLHPRLRKDLREMHENFATKVNDLQAARRRAIVETAARLFELDMGRRPTGYADLVPAYFKAIPLDPTTGKEIAHPF